MKTIKEIRDEIIRLKGNKSLAKTGKISGANAYLQGMIKALEWVME